MSTPVKRIEVMFSSEQIEYLQSIARSKGKSLESLVREAVEELYLERKKEERLEAVQRMAAMKLPVADWEQMERESMLETGEGDEAKSHYARC